MNAIVVNTLNTAVTEYDWDFQSLTPTHAGDAAGLYSFTGDLDGANIIVSTLRTGSTLWSKSLKKFVEMVYFAMSGTGEAQLMVNEYDYSFPVRDSGESRCQPGRGIRENYLQFGFSNPSGERFQIDRIEAVETASAQRRV